MAVPKKGRPLGPPLGPRLGLGEGSKGFGGTGPRDGANLATCVVFLTFNAYKNDFF